MIPIPTNRPTWESAIATYWWEEGMLVSLSKSIRRTVENITENVAVVKEITGSKPVPLLIYLAPSPVPDKATRHFSTQQLPFIYAAMAMISKPGLSKFIMNILKKGGSLQQFVSVLHYKVALFSTNTLRARI